MAQRALSPEVKRTDRGGGGPEHSSSPSAEIMNRRSMPLHGDHSLCLPLRHLSIEMCAFDDFVKTYNVVCVFLVFRSCE
jgi:hypothetical protein